MPLKIDAPLNTQHVEQFLRITEKAGKRTARLYPSKGKTVDARRTHLSIKKTKQQKQLTTTTMTMTMATTTTRTTAATTVTTTTMTVSSLVLFNATRLVHVRVHLIFARE